MSHVFLIFFFYFYVLQFKKKKKKKLKKITWFPSQGILTFLADFPFFSKTVIRFMLQNNGCLICCWFQVQQILWFLLLYTCSLYSFDIQFQWIVLCIFVGDKIKVNYEVSAKYFNLTVIVHILVLQMYVLGSFVYIPHNLYEGCLKHSSISE